MKILNLYAGVGGNRKLWGNKYEVTAVELDPKIAKIYQEFYPEDKVVVGDAHEYLKEHYQEFDFIWSSPPCPSHSMLRKNLSMNAGSKAIYPDMKLYEEILFLQGYFKGNWVVENVKSWYDPLIIPQLIQRHYFWSNKHIPEREFEKDSIQLGEARADRAAKVLIDNLQKKHGIYLPEDAPKKRTLLRNCVNPEVGLYIFKAINEIR